MKEPQVSRKKKLLPWGIIGFFTFLATGLFLVLYISLTYAKVNKENVFMDDYQVVDKNFNEIIGKQQAFHERYAIRIIQPRVTEEPVELIRPNGVKEYFPHVFVIGENMVSVYVYDTENKPVPDATVTGLLTRPTTNELDKKLVFEQVHGGAYVSNPVEIKNPGRWKIIVKVQVDGYQGFEEAVVYAQ